MLDQYEVNPARLLIRDVREDLLAIANSKGEDVYIGGVTARLNIKNAEMAKAVAELLADEDEAMNDLKFMGSIDEDADWEIFSKKIKAAK